MTGTGSALPSLFIATTNADGLVTMWRIELLHPATVHFSVAFTLLGTVFWLAGTMRERWSRLEAFTLAGCVTLCLAALSSWISVLTGFWADEVVGRHLFDPRPLKDHENAGIALAWIMTGAALVDVMRHQDFFPSRMRLPALLAVGIALITGCGFLAYTAHLGAGLVYQQGAGVEMPRTPSP